ncbi:MAG TPA: extracellular solute-binding protein [Chloroflexota bacterium]|nr:extracellular solute-binding protein [Chloroflexota bacterium]
MKTRFGVQGISRRRALAGGGGGVGALLASACAAGPAGQSGGGSGSGSKLTGSFEFWQPWPIEQPTHGGPIGWKQLMDGFNAREGPRAQISTPSGTLETAVQTAFAGGSPPDGWQASNDWVPVWGAKGFAAPLDDLMKRDKWDKNQIFPSALETMSWSGKTWSMMQHPDIAFLWIGVSLLEENGIDGKFVPQSWPQLEEMANKLTKSRGDGWEFVGFLPHIGQAWQILLPQANGAKLISDDGKKAQLDTVEVAEAIEYGKKFVTRLGGVQAIDNWRIALPGGDNRAQGAALGAADIFGQKQMAFINGGNWYADNVRRANRRLGQQMKFNVAPMPSGPRGPRDSKTNVYSGGILEVARKGGPKLDLIWEFMKYTATKEGGINVQRNTADVAASKEAARDPLITGDPDTGLGRKEFYALFEQGVGARDFKHPAVNEIRAEYNKAITSYLRDETLNVRDGLREANRLAQQKIDEFWQQNPTAGQ